MTATIDNKNQAKINSWFSWENKPKIKRDFKNPRVISTDVTAL